MQRVVNSIVTNVNRVGLIGALTVCTLMIFLGGSNVMAGWRIDGARFSQSVHFETSCVDCHTDIEELDRHPEPGNVNKKMTDFFDPDMCLECHDDVQGQIEDDAEHGGEAVEDVKRFLNCIECHDPHYEIAPGEDEEGEAAEAAEATYSLEDDDINGDCMVCHQTLQPDDPDRINKSRDFCFACHSIGKEMPATVPVMDPEQYAQSAHATEDCMTCHPKADQYEHNMQTAVNCEQCHPSHEESVAHEAHTGVSCQACHLGHVVPVRDEKNIAVLWERSAMPGTVTTLHNLIKPDGEGCARCHFNNNTIGAAAMILPPKSVLCMPCHAATFSVGDTTTIISLAVFVIGMLGFVSLWFSGTFAESRSTNVFANALSALGGMLKTLFSARLGAIINTLWYDVFLQRRLYQRSVQRWAIHALIFWPFVIRFVWGILALAATNWLKEWPLAWELINKNHPATALVFDLTGLCLLIGIVLAMVRGSEADKARAAGLPSQDRLALLLIGAIAVVGFVIEGMRIAMTGAHGPAAYAFIGYGISKLFVNMKGLSEVYGYIWYLHAILTGAFVAYLPFSRMMHIIMSPVVLAVNAATEKDHH